MASRTLAKRRDGKEKRVRAAPARPAVSPPETIPESRARAPARLNTTKRSEEHTSELQSLRHLVCRLLLEKKKKNTHKQTPGIPSTYYYTAQAHIAHRQLTHN